MSTKVTPTLAIVSTFLCKIKSSQLQSVDMQCIFISKALTLRNVSTLFHNNAMCIPVHGLFKNSLARNQEILTIKDFETFSQSTIQ